MAYTLSEPPLAREICAFFAMAWPKADLIYERHRSELYDALDRILQTDWLSRVVDPLISDINTCPAELRTERARSLGIGTTGCITSGLVLSADGYELGERWIPCIDLSGLFGFVAEFPRLSQGDGLERPPFFAALHSMIRDAVNVVRVQLGLPRIGEGWFTETYLYYRIKELFPNETVIHHGRPLWLGRQHFDIWLPERNIAIEYQGEQHFIEISLFGGKAGLAKAQQRDARKRHLCAENGVTLIEINFNDDLRDDWIKKRVSFVR